MAVHAYNMNTLTRTAPGEYVKTMKHSASERELWLRNGDENSNQTDKVSC